MASEGRFRSGLWPESLPPFRGKRRAVRLDGAPRRAQGRDDEQRGAVAGRLHRGLDLCSPSVANTRPGDADDARSTAGGCAAALSGRSGVSAGAPSI